MPHGAIMHNTSHGPAMDKWTPSGSGANFKLSPILSSLEPYKKYVSSFGNLENAATAGSVHSFTPSTWLSCTRPDTGRTRAHMAVTLDQVICEDHQPGHSAALAGSVVGNDRSNVGGQ